MVADFKYKNRKYNIIFNERKSKLYLGLRLAKNTQKNILYQNMKLYDDKKEKIII